MIRAVIIDDEDHLRENLKSILNSNFSNVEVVGEGNSLVSGVQVIKDKNPELVFLDINLSDGTGFNILEEFNNLNFNVIFITAYNDYAIKAFRYNALDYLLKPINISELKEAIEKISIRSKKEYVTQEELASIFENFTQKDEDKKLVIRNSNSISYVKVRDIVRCEADGNYTTIYLLNGEKLVATRPLKEYDSLLPDSLFYRVHQSHLINLHFVKQFSKIDGGYLVMEDNTHIVIARRRKEEFFLRLENVIT